MRRIHVALVMGVVGWTGCAAPEEAQDETMTSEPVAMMLGPVDGHDLPAIDLDRIQVGQMAPDFTLAALGESPVTLSSFRGSQNVVLVFYRGHW
jgi:AhpC/TSA family